MRGNHRGAVGHHWHSHVTQLLGVADAPDSKPGHQLPYGFSEFWRPGLAIRDDASVQMPRQRRSSRGNAEQAFASIPLRTTDDLRAFNNADRIARSRLKQHTLVHAVTHVHMGFCAHTKATTCH